MNSVVEEVTWRHSTGELRLPAQASCLSDAREFAERAATSFGLDAYDCGDFAYAVNEAVTNAIRHGAPDADGHIHLSVFASGDRLTLAVRDWGTFRLPVADRRETREHGRGFALMAGLTDDVQIRVGAGGTTVQLSKTRPMAAQAREPGD